MGRSAIVGLLWLHVGSLLTALIPQNADIALSSPAAQPAAAVSQLLRWGYKHQTDEVEPALWSELYPQCAGTRQSPIPIDTHRTFINPSLGALILSNYDQQPTRWTVLNNGHVVQFSGDFARPPTVSGGGLGDEYQFMQMHFHWGSSDAGGSEHVVDGRHFPLELHIVHRRVEDSEAGMTSDPVGIAVIAVLFQLADPFTDTPPNPRFEALTRALDAVLYQDESVNATLAGVDLLGVLPSRPEYYRYLGSLTTPPCAEAVIWSVLANPVSITEDQLARFRRLHERHRPSPVLSNSNSLQRGNSGQDGDDTLVDNYRPPQQLNTRLIQFYPGSRISTQQGSWVRL